MELVVRAGEEGAPDPAKEQDIEEYGDYNAHSDAAALPLRQVLGGIRAVDEIRCGSEERGKRGKK